jgi:excisionase family DNA binding protein
MRITYDKESDVLAILLADAEVEETRNIAPGVEVDYDSGGRVLAIEFLNAGKKYDLRGAELEGPDPFYSLAAAGALFGLSPTTLRHQIDRGVLKGVKMGRNWVVHRDDLDAYMKERSRKTKSLGGGKHG